MDAQTAQRLSELTSAFYRTHAESFAATRTAPWSGWERCVEYIGGLLESAGKPLEAAAGLLESGSERATLTVFDLACGNLRFEAYLNKALPQANIAYYTVDNCAEFAPCPGAPPVKHQHLDVLDLVCKGLAPSSAIEAPLCDIAVCFGFMHHVPCATHREAVLRSLLAQARPGGLVVVSLWQYLKSAKLAQKARATHEQALRELHLPPLDANDFVLGWSSLAGAYRYCHSFSDAEIDQLLAALEDKAQLLARFTADGKTAQLNTYLVLRVR